MHLITYLGFLQHTEQALAASYRVVRGDRADDAGATVASTEPSSSDCGTPDRHQCALA